MNKQHDIVFLPTEDATYLTYQDGIGFYMGDICEAGNSAWRNYHIYILSDEKIKEGDQALLPPQGNSRIVKAIINNGIIGYNIGTGHFYLYPKSKKIIATTDSKLNLLQINPSDLQWIIDQKNKNGIEKIYVEYRKGFGEQEDIPENIYIKDGYIVIWKTARSHTSPILEEALTMLDSSKMEHTIIEKDFEDVLIGVGKDASMLGYAILLSKESAKACYQLALNMKGYTEADMILFSNYLRNGLTNLEYSAKTEVEHLTDWKSINKQQ